MTILFLLATLVVAQEPVQDQPLPPEKLVEQPAAVQGQITGNNVYVRSGPSTNYYPVTKVSAGERITIYDLEPGWVSIAPPKGAFSLVQKEFVDVQDTANGVINGDRVWTYAGSDLSNQRYAKQVKLNKGDQVQILGEADEFYKIAPPPNTKLWISRDFVQGLDGNLPRLVGSEQPAVQLPSGPVPLAEPGRTEPEPYYEGIKNKDSRAAIETLETELEIEFRKDLFERNLEKFRDQFGLIAKQDTDEVAKQYAAYRENQLGKTMQHIAAMKQAQTLDSQVREVREQFLRDRTSIKLPPPPLTRDFVVKGKLITSAAYQGTIGPKRFRLVNPDDKGPMPLTLAYIDIEPDSNIDPQKYIGRTVGIRAAGQRLLENTVDRMVVYTAAEIVILEN